MLHFYLYGIHQLTQVGSHGESMLRISVKCIFSLVARYEVFRCCNSEKLVLLVPFSSVATHFTNGKLAH